MSPHNHHKPHRVGLVLDRAFGDRVRSLATRLHVWLIRSAENEKAAKAIWDEKKKDDLQYSLEQGVTLFDAPEAKPAEVVLRILETILDHNSEYEHDPPMSELEIHGAPETESFLASLTAAKIEVFRRENGGLVCGVDPEWPGP